MMWLSLIFAAAAIVLGGLSLRQLRHKAGIVIGMCGSIICTIPIVTLILMSRGGGSSVAQLSGSVPGGIDWWSLWYELWPKYLFGLVWAGQLAAVGLLLAITFACQGEMKGYRSFVIGHWAALVAQCATCLLLVAANFPSA